MSQGLLEIIHLIRCQWIRHTHRSITANSVRNLFLRLLAERVDLAFHAPVLLLDVVLAAALSHTPHIFQISVRLRLYEGLVDGTLFLRGALPAGGQDLVDPLIRHLVPITLLEHLSEVATKQNLRIEPQLSLMNQMRVAEGVRVRMRQDVVS